MVKITALCSEFPGFLEPSHGFGVLINDNVLFDSCSREAAFRFLLKYQVRPIVGIVGVPSNPHHTGGFELFNIPIIQPSRDLMLKIRGVGYKIYNGGRENVLHINDVIITPCGLYTIPYHKLSQRGLKVRCIVGGLGGSAKNPYLLHRIVAELRLLGVRCIVALHTAPQLLKELERKFNLYKVGAGSTIEV